MRREFDRLREGPFDLLVVGGGIYGAWTACDAALRGLRVALVERTDWAAGTSSASSKLFHGGLRYLERFQLGFVRTSLRERRLLLDLAPHQVRPLEFHLPVYRGDRPGPMLLGLGVGLYRLLGGRDGGGRARLAREEALAATGFLRPDGLRGALRYRDALADDARFTLEVADAAQRAGAVTVNHAEALGLLRGGGRVRGAVVRDAGGGATVEVVAAATATCTGAWTVDLLRGVDGLAGTLRRSKGTHLVLPALGLPHALLLRAPRDGRVFFLIPWYGRTLVGTTDTPFDGDPDAARPTAEDAGYLLEAANRFRADGAWRAEDVIARFAGVRVLQDDGAGTSYETTREFAIREPLPGLLVPVGGKLTSARADAARLVDRVMRELGRPAGACPTAARPLPWRPEGSFGPWLSRAVAAGMEHGLDPEAAACAARRHGARVGEIHRLVAGRPALAARAHPDLPFCRAEIVQAAAAEMVRTLDDLLRRRVPLAILARPDRAWMEPAAALAGETLGWDAARRETEIRALGSLFEPPP
jgi:glycerol-3-phosphate dehydrogenase